ncbi:MAG: outer rane adhesin like protein [Bacteroidetes bacterium]|nr:outer rane adhesin like protein [Bacteroidota bacterium]
MRKLCLLIILAFTVYICQAQAPPKAINDVATIMRPDSILLNVLANDSNFNLLDTVCITGTYGAPAGWVTVQGCRQLVFRADYQFYGIDTFYYISCDQQQPALCDTGRVIVTVRPRAATDRLTILHPDSALIFVLANDSNSIPQDTMCITNLWIGLGGNAHPGWATLHGCDSVRYRPLDSSYYGVDTFFYRSCSQHMPLLCDTARVIVNIIFPPKAVSDTATLTQPDTITIYPIANDTSFNKGDTLCITSVYGVPAGWATIEGCDHISFHPLDFHDAGDDTLYYISCYSQTPAVCDTSFIVIAVSLPLPFVDFTYDQGLGCEVTVHNASELSDSVNWTVQFLTLNGTDTAYGNTNTIYLSAYQDSAFEAEVCATAFNPSGDSTVCYTFWIECSGSNSIHDIDMASVRIYPNPASDKINIDMASLDQNIINDMDAIEVYDMVGKALHTSPVSSNVSISISDLGSGLYIISSRDKVGKRTIIGKLEVIK